MTTGQIKATSRRAIARLWDHFFGTYSPRQLLVRMVTDFAVIHIALCAAATVRLAATGGIGWDNPVGTLIGRINSLYVMHAIWFTTTAWLLFVGLRLYRPLPSAGWGTRLATITAACAIGLVLHVLFGDWVMGHGRATLDVALPAWALLCLGVTGARFSRMYVTTHFLFTTRQLKANSRVESVLVVGGAGYIGSVLTRQLLDAGYRVRVLDLKLFGIEPLRDVLDHSRLEVVEGDFRNVEDVVRSLRGMDAVVHLAAIVGDPACALDNDTTIAVNYAAAHNMAQLSRANGISRFIFASTCSVYGASDDVRDETSEPNPVSLYATTKVDAERALLEVADGVFQPTILRFATAYGWSHRPRFDLVANLFSAQAVTDGRITVVNGEQWRPFVHTYDIARSCKLCLEAPLRSVGGEIFNVGDETQNYTIGQLGEIVAAAQPGTQVLQVRNDDDPRNYRVSFDKIRETLGYRASVSLEKGIQEIVDSVNAGQVADWHDPIHSNRRYLEGSGLDLLRLETYPPPMKATQRFLSKAA